MSLLLTTILQPSLINSFNSKDWELLIRQARSAQLLSYLANLLTIDNVFEIPFKAKQHLEAALIFSKKQKSNVTAECDRIGKILSDIGIKSIFLKGAAYSLTQLPLSDYRLLSDIDIMINKSELAKAENILFNHGWFSESLTDYDNMYYRKWSHEIPPLKHIKRQTVLDLHHNILPITTINSHIEESALHNNIVAINKSQYTYVLPSHLMLLHSAAHLFYESEFNKGLRDLIDIKELFLSFSSGDDEYCNKLIIYAKELGLERTLFYAMRYIEQILKCELPSNLKIELLPFSPPKAILFLMDFSFKNIFIPFHSSCYTKRFEISKTILYWRGHLLRMPLRLLVPHLTRKFFMQLKS